MINGIEYIDYDKISDDLCWLGNKCIVRLVVKLANKNKDGYRNHFHREYKYPANYVDKREVITMRRSFSYYISIDNLEYNQSSIIITVNDMIMIRTKLNEVFNWFYDRTFALKNGKMIILEKKHPVIIDGLVGGKCLKFEPIIYTDRDDIQSKGIRITFNEDHIYSDVPANVFSGFVYLMNSINIFTEAQNLINYIGHPDFGTNLFTYERSEYVGREEPKAQIKERKIPINKSKFSSMDDLM